MAPEVNYVYKAKVLRVFDSSDKRNPIYDGDTITVFVDYGFREGGEKMLRLARIDTPELRGEEKEEGERVRNIVRDKIPVGSEILIKSDKDYKRSFNRYIAEIWFEGENINDWLLNEGYAVEYK